jgi:ParB-like chromosome segregation protein Spo0J
VPGIIRKKFDRFAQMAENMKREGITALEIAEFIRDELAQGRTQSEIAVGLGKSKAWVTQHAKMLDLPPAVAEAVATGKVTDVTLASELAVAHREDPQAVADLLKATESKPTRSAVKAIRRGGEAQRASPAASQQSPEDHIPSANDASVPSSEAAPKLASSGLASAAREISPEAKAEFQRHRDRLVQDRKDAANPALRKKGADALARLIHIALRDTGQSCRVASFLLAWWNATNCGGFDLTDFWSVDPEVADDMLSVIAVIRQTRAYPDIFGTEIRGQFETLVALWRPQLSESRPVV